MSLWGLAQSKHLQFNHLTTDNGLSSSNILCILQDHKGFIWIGTYDGVNRFDGKEFKVYKNEPNNKNSLPDNLIRSLLLDENNDLYVGTNTGISKYNPLTDQFINFNKDSSSCLYDFAFQANDIDKDKNGIIWIASSLGLIRFDVESNKHKLYTNDGSENSISSSRVTRVFVDKQSRIWVSTINGLNLYNSEEESFKLIHEGVKGENFSGFLFWSISEDQSGNIWFNSENGLFKADDSDPENIRLVQYKNNPDDQYSISPNLLSSSYVDSENRLWVGAENNGLYLYNREKDNFQQVAVGSSRYDFLSSTSVNAIFNDRSGNLWFGTYGHGILIAPENGNSISSYEEIFAGGTTYGNLLVNCFLEDSKGRFWIGTDGKGIFQFNKKTEKFTNFSTLNSSLANNYVLSMVEGNNGNIWLATWDGGLTRFMPEESSFESFNTENSSIPDNKLYSICRGDNNDFWLGSHFSGLIHFNAETLEFNSIKEINNEAGNNTVNIVQNDKKGNLYVGTTTGILIYKPKEKQIRNIPEIERNVGIVEVNDIEFENDTSIWFGTLMGIDRFNPVAKSFEHFSVSNGLPGNVISGLLIDDSGILWASTTNGICSINRKENKVSVFTRDDGLQSNEFKARSIAKDADGNLYFGGVNGFNIINPNNLVQNMVVPEIQITGLDIHHMPVTPTSPGSPLKRIISETDEIILNYNQSVLTFYFASLDYTSPNKNEHAYKLDDFDGNWIYCGNTREATYTNLDPGKYTFRVIGSNNDGVWNEEGTSLNIIIVPPWWQTLWFRILLVVFIILLIVAIVYIRISSLEKQKHVLEENVKKRTEELAKINTTKDKLFSIIGHDLKNPFNIILGYTNLLIEGFENYDKETLNVILADLKESGENAYALLENLLNWSRTQRGMIEFMPQNTTSGKILVTIISEVNSLAKKKNIKIVNQANDKNFPIFGDSNMLLLICRNLMTNAIKFSNSGQSVIVDVNKENESVVFSFTDQGVGINQDKLKTLFDLGESNSSVGTGGEKGTGLGLILCKEFVLKHGGDIWVESEPGAGSVFYFSLPEKML